jgi:uncharacterized membrane protein
MTTNVLLAIGFTLLITGLVGYHGFVMSPIFSAMFIIGLVMIMVAMAINYTNCPSSPSDD